MLFEILVPKLTSPYAKTIDPRSAIVGRAGHHGYWIIDYEGNRSGAANLKLFDERLLHAAGRGATRYPTTARLYIRVGELESHFDVVGSYNYETKHWEIRDPQKFNLWMGGGQ